MNILYHKWKLQAHFQKGKLVNISNDCKNLESTAILKKPNMKLRLFTFFLEVNDFIVWKTDKKGRK